MGVFSELLEELDSPEFQELRKPQVEVLEQYEERLDSLPSDVGIEMPAGTGKTLVAFLIAEYHRRNGKTVAMLEGTRQLAAQTFDEAQALGVPAVHFAGSKRDWSRADLRNWRRRNCISILNYWGYMNSRPGLRPAEVLILDDAHLAEYRLLDLFSARIPRREAPDLFDQLLTLIHDLHPGRYPLIEDLIRERHGVFGTLLLPFHDLFAIRNPLAQLLERATIDSVTYTWPTIRDRLPFMALYINPYEVLIRPVIAPSLDWDHFSEPDHRLYLSATIGDRDDFSRRLGCHRPSILSPTTAVPRESGRRLVILFPSREGEQEILPTIRAGLRRLWPVGRRRLWMCRSWAEVELWEGRVPRAKDRGQIYSYRLEGSGDNVLPLFRTTQPAHLFTAARYDGMDFPGDDCRLAFITSPPVCCDAQEDFFSAQLRDARLLKSRFSQRVAQALGRCNRSSADFAVYVLLDPRFDQFFGGSDPDYLEMLPSDMIPEIDHALELCDQGFEGACEVAARFLRGDFTDWEENIGAARPTPLRQGPLECQSNLEVEAFLAMWRSDSVVASERLQRLLDSGRVPMDGYHAFLRYCKAWCHYLRGRLHAEDGQAELSLQELEQAARGGTSSWFTQHLRASAVDIQNDVLGNHSGTRDSTVVGNYRTVLFDKWDGLLYDKGLRPHIIADWIDKLRRDLRNDSHDDVAEGLQRLCRLLGYNPMPCRGQGAPDSLWRYESDPRHIITWEVKVETSRQTVSINDVNQAHGHNRWATRQFRGEGFFVLSVIAANMPQIDPRAAQRLDGLRCVPLSLVQALSEKVIGLFETYRSAWLPNDPGARSRARTLVENSIPDGSWLKTAIEADSRNCFVSEAEFLGRWTASA